MVRRSTLAIAGLVALAASFSSTPASAQAVAGLGDDAMIAPTGQLRISVQPSWTYADQRFGLRGSTSDTQLRALGAPFTVDTLGAAQLPLLAPVQDSIRALAGVQGIDVSLGRTITQATRRVQTVPINMEVGLARWLSIEVSVPIVHTRSSIFFRANPSGKEANLGVNPALGTGGALASDTAFANQMIRSATAVQAYCTGTGSGSSQCSGSPALVASAQGFGRTATSVYTQSYFVPIQTSDVQASVNARASTLTSALNAYAAIPGSGVPAVTATGLVGAPTPLATPDLQTVLSEPQFGVQLDPFKTIERTHLGDIELTGKVLLFDSFALRGISRFEPHGVNARISVGGGYRFPTGRAASANDAFDPGTGTHASAVLARGYADIVLGRRLWTSVVARYATSASDTVSLRIAPGVPFPPVSALTNVDRKLGAMLEIEATPRWEFNDFVAIGGQYRYRHKAQDTFTGASPAVSAFAIGSDFAEQRVGGGIVFSNAHAVSMHRSRVPIDVSFLHMETIAGRGGIAKTISDEVLVRLYVAPHR